MYDFTRDDVEKMFFAMQDSLDSAKAEFEKKFEAKAKAERKVFSFDTGISVVEEEITENEEDAEEIEELV